MNLISVMMAGAIGLILLTAMSQGMINQAKLAVKIEYLNDKQTARNMLELKADCKQSQLNTCTVNDKLGNELLGVSAWQVGQADVIVLCDSDGFNVFAKQRNRSLNWEPLVPLKVCGNGGKVCNTQQNADGISCTGGSNSYEVQD
jgi:hypothetical protein